MMQNDLFDAPLERAPVMVAYGGGVDSTAMIIEMVDRNEPIDLVLMALTHSENPLTDAYVDIFADWMKDRGILFERVEYKARNFKQWAIYQGLYENCLANATLPSITFGFNSCSCKNKIAPQQDFIKRWDLGQKAIRQGVPITKCIGFDAGPQDSRRYAEREGYKDPHYLYRYPLREWGWSREDCEARIKKSGLPVPHKSACIMCAATKPAEVDKFTPQSLRRIILLEARSKPRLREVDGIWRKPVLGKRGGTPRPGSMTEYIRTKGLLPEAEIALIEEEATRIFAEWQGKAGNMQVDRRPTIKSWLDTFEEEHQQMSKQGVYARYSEHLLSVGM